ncbi:acireductone synthase [Roseomonas sp. BN140053]|uniref:acireductone synthase n=1 Tax=Roseomonas sp. BN140053 TaxID=3391898 RepID=UPI0039ED848D
MAAPTASGAAPTAAVVTDIEGTTSAISFVKDTLFPFAEAALDGFLEAQGSRPELAAILEEVRRLAPDEAPRDALHRWMAEDAKVTPLKAIQGMIWRQGFEDGRLRGHLYPDVAPSLRAWARGGLRLCVYSSGSAEAQELLFGYSVAGDLRPLFTRFFDTRIGTKREAGSYRTIAAGLHLPAAEILFLSDIAAELDAAAAAGLRTCQLLRPADGTQPSGRHPEAADFPAVAARFSLPRV